MVDNDQFEAGDNYKLDDDLSFDSHDLKKSKFLRGDPIEDRPLLNSFFDTDAELYTVYKLMTGHQKLGDKWVKVTHELASTRVINVMLSSLSSVIGRTKFFLRAKETKINEMLMEMNLVFIDFAYNVPYEELPDYNFEVVLDIYDKALRTFCYSVEGGQAAQSIIQMSTGTYDLGQAEKVYHDNKSGISSWNIFKARR